MNVTLKHLDLSYNGFGSEGAQALGDALRHNNTLLSLDLSSNRITHEAVKLLCHGLAFNDTLRVIRVGQASGWALMAAAVIAQSFFLWVCVETFHSIYSERSLWKKINMKCVNCHIYQRLKKWYYEGHTTMTNVGWLHIDFQCQQYWLVPYISNWYICCFYFIFDSLLCVCVCVLQFCVI